MTTRTEHLLEGSEGSNTDKKAVMLSSKNTNLDFLKTN